MKKRTLSVFAGLAAGVLLLAGGLYTVLILRLKDLLAYAVETQTKGAYVLRADDIRVSLWDRAAALKGVVLTPVDTAHMPLAFDIRIPEAYLSIESWRELLEHRRLAIDSFSVVQPVIIVRDSRPPRAGLPAGGFRTSMILENLQKALDHIHARSFSVNHGSLAIYRRGKPEPFQLRDVSLAVRNFLKIDNNDRHLFGSDQIDLTLGRQRWVLADGRTSLSLGKVRFSSATQLFEVDSVLFEKPATAEQEAMTLRADQFFFNSRHLPALYQKGELSLDTVVCVRPVLHLSLRNRKATPADTAASVHTNLTQLFKSVEIGYLQVKDGEVQAGNSAVTALRAGTRTANLNVYGLTFRPRRRPSFQTDSIRLDLKNTTFFSKDSLFQIAVKSFSLRNREVVFEDVEYGPVRPAAGRAKMTFVAPLLSLRDIRLEELLQKRLVASEAVLYRPSIRLVAALKRNASADTLTPAPKDLYQTLHGLAELLQVQRFQVVDASAGFQKNGPRPVRVDMKHLDATILLPDLLRSDSLVDIKHAIPRLTVGDTRVEAGKARITLKQYTFDGKNRRNWVDQLEVKPGNGTSVTAGKLYWEVFDWDVFQKTKTIQVALIRAGTLALDIRKETTPSPDAPPADTTRPDALKPRKTLPRLQIGQLLVGHLSIHAALPKTGTAEAEGTDFTIQKLRTDARYFHWEQAGGLLTGLRVEEKAGRRVSAGSLRLDSRRTSTVTDFVYSDDRPGRTTSLQIPKLTVEGPFASTDFSVISLRSVHLDQPQVSLTATQKAGQAEEKKPFSIPVSLAVGDLSVNRAQVNVISRKEEKKTQVRAVADITARTIRSTLDGNLLFASLSLNTECIRVETPTINLTVPHAGLDLTSGRLFPSVDGRLSLTSRLKASWTLENLRPPLKGKNGKPAPEVRVGRLTGETELPAFAWTAGQKVNWVPWIDQSRLKITDLSYHSTGTLLEAGSLSWEEDRLQIDTFAVRPAITKEAFLAPSQKQGDYVTIRGDRILVRGFSAAKWREDSVIAVRHIRLENLTTDISRDKRLPLPDVMPEKHMPTRLLAQVKMPLRIDSVSLVNARVTYHERSKVTNQESHIPLRELNGTLTHLTNRAGGTHDSLTLTAGTRLLDLNIHRLTYRESYSDSLSGFRLQVATSDLSLPGLTAITHPMAAANLEDGWVKPVVARISGNKYAATGHLRFHYQNLRVRLLNRQDTTRKSLIDRLKNMVVRAVLRRKNEEDSRIYVARDRKKFVFNYWIKSLASGVMTSVGVKKDRKYRASYRKMTLQHPLPPEEE